DGRGVVLPKYQGRQGHPVAFAADCADALLALAGPQGAALVARAQREANRGLELELDDPGIVTDIDTVQDLARAEQMLARR
ncbi:MAG: hypothetical protein JWQ33_476, partial [Ramlibacter sp.]|nr:hypothetical protein [Ramlibacter sp.]